MNALDITIITLLAVLATACIIVAIVFSAWWHIYPASCFASLAWVLYNEEKPEYEYDTNNEQTRETPL